jgi:hypothetical protein
MDAMDMLHEAAKVSRIGYRDVSVILGVLTFAAFGMQRYSSNAGGPSLGDLPAYVLGGVVLLVGATAFHASMKGQALRTAVLITLGPIGGFLAYLIGYHLVLPASADSPTFVIFIGFVGGLLATGVGAYLSGRLLTRMSLTDMVRRI